ncbi:MAG: hypothetical protein ABJC59_00410 [Anderseniella sp.]
MQRPVGLASALTCFGLELIVKAGSGSENGPPQADKLFDQWKQNGPPQADKLFDQWKQNGPPQADKLFDQLE